MRKSYLSHQFIFILLWIFSIPSLESSPATLISKTGRDILFNHLKDLQTSTSFLIVATRPGEEDLAGIAYLKFHCGAKVQILYLTNGECRPNDAATEDLQLTATRRKEEALAVSEILDFSPFFFNLPDPEIIRNTEEFNLLWNRDSLKIRFQAFLRNIQPDVILLNIGVSDISHADPINEMIQRFLLGSIYFTYGLNNNGPNHEDVNLNPLLRLFSILPSQNSFSNILLSMPATKNMKSYAGFRLEAGSEYKSLHYQLPLWQNDRNMNYCLQYSRTKVSANARIDDLLALSVKDFGGISYEVGELVNAIRKKPTVAILPTIAKTILHIQDVIQNGNYRMSDRKALARWKRTLEDVRCDLLGIIVHVTFKEPVITPMQLFELRIDNITSLPKGGKTIIHFAKNNTEWIINESDDDHFPLSKLPIVFRILSPENIKLDLPMEKNGMKAESIGTEFIYAIIHEDPYPERNFIYQRSLNLRIAQPHTFELLTRTCAATSGENIIYRATNYSRNPAQAEITIEDTSVFPVSRKLDISRRYLSITDSIRVEWKSPPSWRDSIITLWVSHKVPHPINVRLLPNIPQIDGRVGLIVRDKNSILPLACDRIHVRWSYINPPTMTPDSLHLYSTIIIDREAADISISNLQSIDQIKDWLAHGGRLIVLSQFLSRTFTESLKLNERFNYGADYGSFSSQSNGTACYLADGSKEIRHLDFSGWVPPVSFGCVTSDGNQVYYMNNRQCTIKDSMIHSLQVQRGRIILVALNLDTQLINIVPSAYGLLASLLTDLP
jgi:hypothetical protein